MKTIIPQHIKTLMYAVSVTLVLVIGCASEEDFTFPVQPSHPDAQVLVNAYANDLVAAEFGWEGLLMRSAGKVYHLHFRFNENIEMLADVDTVSAVEKSSSQFSLLVKNKKPTIEFLVGSHLDRMQNPDDNDGVDKEYTIKGKTDTQIFLQGNLFGDELILTKATSGFSESYTNGSIKKSIKNILQYLPTVRLLYFEPEDGNKIQFIVRSGLRSTYFTYIQNEKAEFYGSDYSYTFNGFQLKNPFSIHGVDITNIGFENGKFYAMYNGARLYAKEATVPVIPLHYLLGNEFSSGVLLIAEWYSKQPGWSYKFREQWTLTDYDLNEKQFGLGLLFVYIDLNPDNNTMKLNINTMDLYGRLHVAEFPYKFSKSSDGTFDFEPLPIDTSTTRGQYADQFKTEFSRMLNIINNYTFTIDFYDYQGELMPQYQSKEDIEMYFTGSFY